MNVPALGAIGAATFVILTLIGIRTLIRLLSCIAVLTLGILTCLYRANISNLENEIKNNRENLYQRTEKLCQMLLEESKKKVTFTLDRRVTGSHVIDESLQEILDFVLRDYVEPWYNVLTSDEEFTKSVRDTAQKIAINVANRIKDVDWIPYITTRLVDDAASHMKLYRQARSKLKDSKNSKIQKGSSSSSTSGGTPKKTPSHRRNKSETDVFWYSQSRFYTSNLTCLTEPKPASQEKEIHHLEKAFFDLEVQMENNLICRDVVCTDPNLELTFLGEVSEMLLYLLLPKSDFNCLTMRFILRELLVNVIIKPLLDLFSDPDYINQAFIWLCTKETTLPSDIFLTVIRMTDNLDELKATKNLVCKEIAHLRSKDSGGEDNLIVKQQLNSLLYVKKILETRIISMKEGLGTLNGSEAVPDWSRLLVPTQKLVNLPLDELLKNNIALSYFIDYMTSVCSESYLYFYLNIYGWRVSAEQQISEIELQKIQNSQPSSSQSSSAAPPKRKNDELENLKEAAVKIYQQYLSDKSSSKLQLDDGLVKTLLTRIKTEPVKETWFDELQTCCYDKLQNEERFLPAFKRSVSYVKLLAELDLLKDPTSEDDSKSLDSISLSSMNNELDSLAETSTELSKDKHKDDSRSVPNLTHITKRIQRRKFGSCDELDGGDSSSCSSKGEKVPQPSYGTDSDTVSEGKDLMFYVESNGDQFMKIDDSTYDQNAIRKLQQSRFDIVAEIIETGVVNDRGKTYGIYAVAVTKIYDSGYQEKWHIYRRYSDFYDLYQKVKDKYYDLAKIPFPAKKAFHNMDRTVLERRMVMLNSWLTYLMKSNIVEGHMGLQNLLLAFLEQGDYDKVTGGQISRTIDTIVNPLKTSIKSVTQAVRSMPDNMINTVGGVMDDISKFLGNSKKNNSFESVKVGAGLDETDDNIPLRIILLLMDEVFDLKNRNQWLRRRIVTLLRQIIRTMFGDIVNRRIVEYVSYLTSPNNVVTYLRLFKNSFWPNGVLAEAKPPRDPETKSRTRVAAKVALLSCFSDDLKHIIGSDTTRRGLIRVFELFQRPILNRRLLYVFLEGIIENLFPQADLVAVFQKLYTISPRVRSKIKGKS